MNIDPTADLLALIYVPDIELPLVTTEGVVIGRLPAHCRLSDLYNSATAAADAERQLKLEATRLRNEATRLDAEAEAMHAASQRVIKLLEIQSELSTFNAESTALSLGAKPTATGGYKLPSSHDCGRAGNFERHSSAAEVCWANKAHPYTRAFKELASKPLPLDLARK